VTSVPSDWSIFRTKKTYLFIDTKGRESLYACYPVDNTKLWLHSMIHTEYWTKKLNTKKENKNTWFTWQYIKY